MTSKKRLALTLVAVAITVAMIVTTSFALFTDFATDDTTATAGTVDVLLENLDLTNPDNINPGDQGGDDTPSDPTDNSGEKEPGTPHDLTFDVTNNGNKSIRTRNVIFISCYEEVAGVKTYKDPSKFAIEEKNASGVWKALTPASYIYEATTSPSTYLEADTLAAVPAGKKVVGIKYIAAGKIFDGVGTGAETGDSNITAADKTTFTYNYRLAMDKTALNDYQGVKVDIEVLVQALQFRNTDGTEWSNATLVGSGSYTTNIGFVQNGVASN